MSRKLRHPRRRILSPFAGCVVGLAVLNCGCEKSPPPEFRFNQAEFIKQERLQLADGEHFPEQYKKEIGNLVTALFGTPDEPKFPTQLGDPDDPVVDVENLKMAAGAVKIGGEGQPSGLYREHCAHCHGITGDGAGPTAAFLNPYPRDFRVGKFKFKSTPLRQAPTDEDLTNILRDGIPGTAMPSFRTLDPQKTAALIDYVKYLTIRGQFERRLVAELGNLDGQPLLDVSWIAQEKANETKKLVNEQPELAEHRETFENQLFDLVSGILIDEGVLERWIGVDDAITEVPQPPLSISRDSPDNSALISTGKALFVGKANCVQCHGETGVGDGQTENFDDWTNDWGKTSGVNLDDPTSFVEFLSAGVLTPRPIRPRNLRLPVFRGGSHPADVYRRIANGIEGTPMPSQPALTSEEIWALVAYVKAMPYEPSLQQSTSKPVNEQAIR